MCYVSKVMIAIAFTLPKVNAVLLSFVWTVRKKALKKSQHNHFPKLKLQILARKENFVPGDKCQYALLVCRQPVIHINPVQCG